MRDPDVRGPVGDGWKVPLDRLTEWVLAHEPDIHPATKGDLFTTIWRDVWYVRFAQAALTEDMTLRYDWVAVVLRDLRNAPADVPRMYAEAEWEVIVYHCDPAFGTPPVNGEALFEWDQTRPPPILYPFHGLTDRQVLSIGTDPRRPITFAQFVVEAICVGATRPDDETWGHRFSALVNGIRGIGYGDPPRRALEIAPRTGLLVELEDGSTISLPGEVVT